MISESLLGEELEEELVVEVGEVVTELGDDEEEFDSTEMFMFLLLLL